MNTRAPRGNTAGPGPWRHIAGLVLGGLALVGALSVTAVAQAPAPEARPGLFAPPSLLPPPRPPNFPPYAPTLLSPPNTWAPALHPAEVLFSWRHTGDPEHNLVRFFFMLFQYYPATQQWILVAQHVATEGTSLLVTGLQPGSYYSWRVSTFDEALWSPPSAPSFFATHPTGPSAGR